VLLVNEHPAPVLRQSACGDQSFFHPVATEGFDGVDAEVLYVWHDAGLSVKYLDKPANRVGFNGEPFLPV
jgi:hypothetical protein